MARIARRRYLVTGGCGFIGSHLVDALVGAGAAVRVLDDLSTGARENLTAPCELMLGDAGDPDTLRAALEDVDGCFHLAAVASVVRCNREWGRAHRLNQSAAISLFELARPGALDLPVVYASSAAVYGRSRDLPLRETTPPAPVSAYGADKLGCELHARAGAEVHGLRAIGLRFFNVYGPRQDPASPYSGVISIFADRIARGRPVTIFGDGQQSRDFVYVGDVVNALAKSMDLAHGLDPGIDGAPVFNVCTGRATTVAELARTLGRVTGRPAALSFEAAREGDIRHSLGSPVRSQAALGLGPACPLADGLERTLSANLVPH